MIDLVKDNENLKKECNSKEKEIIRLTDTIYKLKWKLNRADRRLDKLNNRETALQAENDEEDDPLLNPHHSNAKYSAVFFLKGYYVPKNVEFRLEFLQEEYYSNSFFSWIQVNEI